MKKKLSLLLMLSLMALLSTQSFALFGFGKKKGPKVIQFMVSDDKLEGAPITKMVEKYNAMQDKIEIQIVELPYKDARAKVKTMISAKKPPALMKVSGLDEFAGALLELDDVIDKNSYTLGVRDEMTLGGGKNIVAMPLNLTVNGMLYNKDLFKKAGVKVPTGPDDLWTWEEFEEAVKTVVEKTDARFGMVFDYSEHRWKTMMYQFGGYQFDKEGNPKHNNPENRAALEYFIHLHKAGIIPEDVWLGGEDSSNLFKTGTVATIYSGSWRVLDYAKSIDSFDWGVVLMPKAKMRSTTIGGNYIAAFKGSGYEQEAKDFIKWVNEDANYTELSKYGNYIPARQGITPKYEFGGDSNLVFSLEAAEVSDKALNDKLQSSKYKGWSNILRKNLVFALQGEKTVEEALKDTETEFLQVKK